MKALITICFVTALAISHVQANETGWYFSGAGGCQPVEGGPDEFVPMVHHQFGDEVYREDRRNAAGQIVYSAIFARLKDGTTRTWYFYRDPVMCRTAASTNRLMQH
jgi:hypothetical protein